MTAAARSEPICPSAGGLRETLRAKIDWFLQRAKGSDHRANESVAVCLTKRTAPYEEEQIGSELWRNGELIQEKGRMVLEPSDAEVWLEMHRTRLDLVPTLKGNHIDAAMAARFEYARREYYAARDGGGSFEILETRLDDDRWQMEVSIPLHARREQPLAHGELRNFDDEWTKPAIETALEKYPLERVLADTHTKMLEQTYSTAIKLAKEMRGPKIVELGANYWPVLPLSVLTSDPDAEYATVDVHYNGLWVMERLLEQEAPELLPRVHRHIMDFTDPLPLASGHFDLALAVAAFGPRHQPESTCAAATTELHRVLKPGGLLVFNGASFEERASPLLWLFLQLFDVVDQRACGPWRTLIARKRTNR